MKRFLSALTLVLTLASLASAAPRHRKKPPMPAPSPEVSFTPVPEPSTSPIPSANLSLDLPAGKELTLDKAISMAIDGASSVLKSETAYSFSGAQLLQAYGQFLPNLIGTGTYRRDSGQVYSTAATPVHVDGTSRNATGALTATLNLFNGFSDFANLKSSSLKRDAAELTLKRAREEIALDVAQSFLQVILDDKLVDISRKNLQASVERERLLKEQTDVGVKNLADLFRQQAQTSQDESAYLSAQNKLRSDQVILLRKLRVEVDAQFHFVEPVLPDAGSVTPTNEATLTTQALDRRMDLRASNENADAAAWDVHTAAGNYFPKLDLFGSVATGAHYLNSQTVNGVSVVPINQDPMSIQLGHQLDYSVGVNLTWTIFDRFLTKENIGRARLFADNARIDAEDRRLQVQGEVKEAYGSFITARQQLQASKKGIDAAQKAYEVMDGRYGVGAASFLDLVTAQAVLVQAESTRVQAVVNYQLQERSLRFAVGEDPTITGP